MSDHFFNQIEKSCSPERLSKYRSSNSDSNIEILSTYIWNMALSEALYPFLQAIEVSFRNSIHSSATAVFNSPEWFFPNHTPAILETSELAIVQNAIDKLKKQGKSLEPGRIVAELSFGFWTSLLDIRYEQRLWYKNPGLLEEAFKGFPRRIRTRPKLSARFNKIRLLRNRVFHYEPIWKQPTLLKDYESGCELLKWINPELSILISVIDRFPSVYSQGPDPYRQKIIDVV